MVKLEVKNASSSDKGVYNLIAKNEKGEVVSNPIEVKEVAEEKLEKPSIDQKLKSIVSHCDECNVCVIFPILKVLTLIQLTNKTYIAQQFILFPKYFYFFNIK